MSEHHSRRSFLTTTAASCGAVCLAARLGLAEENGVQLQELREQLRLDFQKQLMAERAVLFRRLVARFGKDVLDEVSANTIEQTRKRLQEAELAHRDLTGVKAYLWESIDKGFAYTCVSDTPTRLEYRVTSCFLAEEMRRLDAAEIGAAFYCAYDLGFCQGLSPKIRFTRTKTLMRGDSCCNHTYELAE